MRHSAGREGLANETAELHVIAEFPPKMELEFEVRPMSSSDAPSKSRRVDSVTIPSLLDEEEPSLSTLGRPDLHSSSASASRERSASWGAVPWGSVAGSGGEEPPDQVG